MDRFLGRYFHRTQSIYRLNICALYFIYGLIFSSWASRIPDIKQTLLLGDKEMGMVLLCMPAGHLFMMAISGILVKKYHSKYMVLIALSVYPILLIGIGLAASMTQLCVALFCFGLASNLFNISVNTQGVNVERIYMPRSIMSFFHGLWSLGAFLGGIIGGICAHFHLLPIQHFMIVWAVSLIFVWKVRNRIVPRDVKKKVQVCQTGTKLISMPLVLLGILTFFTMTSEGAMLDWSGIYFKDVLRVGKEQVLYGYIAFMFAMCAARFVTDGCVNRFGPKKVLIATGLMITGGLVLSISFDMMLTAMAGFFLCGLGTACGVPLCMSLGGKLDNVRGSTAITVISSISFCGFLISPPLIGFTAEVYGLKTAFAGVAVTGLLTAILVPFAVKRT